MFRRGRHWAIGLALLALCSLTAYVWADGGWPAAGMIGGPGPPGGSVPKLTVVLPGQPSERMSGFWPNEFNARMRAELQLELELEFVPWPQYFDRLALMLSTGEAPDLFWDGDPERVAGYLQMDRIMPLGELLAAHGPNVLRHIPPHALRAATADGRVWGIPGSDAPSSARGASLLARGDLLAEAGMTAIRSAQELTAFGRAFKARYPDDSFLMQDGFIKPYMREFAPPDVAMTALGAHDALYVNELEPGAAVYSTFENEQLMRGIAELLAGWRSDGFFDEAQLTDPESAANRLLAGDLAVATGAAARASAYRSELRRQMPAAELEAFVLRPERARYIDRPADGAFHIAAGAPHAEAAVRWLDWLYERREHYEFAMYGVEGVDYRLEGERIVPLVRDELFPEWMFMDTRYRRYPADLPQRTIEKLASWDAGAQPSKLLGFLFDNERVRLEEAQIRIVYARQIMPILTGFAVFDKHYDDAVRALRQAGIDAYRAEYERQLGAYLAAGGG